MDKLYCHQCKSLIDEKEINIDSRIYHCVTCDGYLNITNEQIKHGVKRSLKSKVKKPTNITVVRNDKKVTATISASKKDKLKCIPLVVFIVFIIGFTMTAYRSTGNPMFYVVSIPVVMFLTHLILSEVYQKKEFVISKVGLSYRVKTYYSPIFSLNYKQPISNIAQLYVRSRKISNGDNGERTVYDLNLLTNDDQHASIIKKSTSPDVLFYLEQWIEGELGIEDSIHPDESPNMSSIIPTITDFVNLIKQDSE